MCERLNRTFQRGFCEAKVLKGSRTDMGELPGVSVIIGDGPHRKGKVRKIMNG